MASTHLLAALGTLSSSTTRLISDSLTEYERLWRLYCFLPLLLDRVLLRDLFSSVGLQPLGPAALITAISASFSTVVAFADSAVGVCSILSAALDSAVGADVVLLAALDSRPLREYRRRPLVDVRIHERVILFLRD